MTFAGAEPCERLSAPSLTHKYCILHENICADMRPIIIGVRDRRSHTVSVGRKVSQQSQRADAQVEDLPCTPLPLKQIRNWQVQFISY